MAPITKYYRLITLLVISTLAGCEQKTPAGHTSSTGESPPLKSMHPSWDKDANGINDCEDDGSCDHTIDYTQVRSDVPATATEPAQIKPSFDCTQVEEGSIAAIVCADNELARQDNNLASVYSLASEKAQNMQPNLLPAEQRGWIKGRDECWKSEDKKQCITEEYQRRTYELQARYGLVASKGPHRFVCGESPANEIIVTFYETATPTLIAERGDSISLMYLQRSASGAKYQGRNESFWEHQGEATVIWGYGTPEFVCKKTE